jgi:hypothetical protein
MVPPVDPSTEPEKLTRKLVLVRFAFVVGKGCTERTHNLQLRGGTALQGEAAGSMLAKLFRHLSGHQVCKDYSNVSVHYGYQPV